MRRLTWLFALILVPALLLTAHNATASASPTTDPKDGPLRVYGERTWQMQLGIKYWNELAGRTVIQYAGPRMPAAAAGDPHTVAVMVAALPDKLAGLTAGNVGQTALAITIDPGYVSQWVVYAHEFGHTLGFDHDNGPGYNGVMSYASMWQDLNPEGDRKLVLGRGH